jgi:hypothetical protein
MTVADEVRSLTDRYGVKVSEEYAERLAGELNRLADIEGDETLELLADLMRLGKISTDQCNQMILRHVREQPNG